MLKHYAEGEGEMTNLIKVWSLVLASLCYCFFLSKAVPSGFSRLLSLIPVLILNLIHPLSFHTIHLRGFSAFFLVWLTNFKLLLLAFGSGPLSDPSISLPKFAAFACLPVKAAHEITDPSKRGLKSFWNYAAKALVMCLVSEMYGYTDVVHPKVTWVLYCLHIYCGLEIILAVLGGVAKAVIGIELEPQFDEPYLSASLQDFWGRRWNMMVSKILRPSVYEHVLKFSTRITGRRWAALPAVIATFFVSGLMHELIFYYMGCWRPSGALTALLMVHGVCMAAEVAVKKVIKGRWRLPWLLTWLLTSGFLMATATWLFIPELLRCNVIANASDEYAALWAFVKDVTTYYALPIPN